MSEYITSVQWDEQQGGVLSADGKPEFEVCSPPEFGGKDGVWTPEDLLSASVGSCLMMTALFFVKKMNVGLKSLTVKANAKMVKGAGGLEFTGVDVVFAAGVSAEADRQSMEKIVHQSEKYCPVSGVLKCPVEISLDCTVA